MIALLLGEPVATLSVGLLELFPPTTVAVTSELRLADRWSVAGTTGLGLRSIDGGGTTTAWHAVLAPRWYLLGHFAEGLHVGWALTYARAVTGPVSSDLEPPPGAGTGPLIGYKAALFHRVALGFEFGLLHVVWASPEAGSLPWVAPWGDLTAGVSF